MKDICLLFVYKPDNLIL